MNDSNEECYSSGQNPTSPVLVNSPKDSSVRPHGEKLKMMNPTPNGYSSVPNHKHKLEGQDSVSKSSSESSKSNDHQKHSSSGKHNSDHVKKKEGSDVSKHKSSSSSHSSKPKESLNSKDGAVKSDSSKPKSEHSSNKEKKHHSSHKDGSGHSKDGKHPESSKHSSLKKEGEKPEDKLKEHSKHSSSNPKLDNFKENEKVKEGKLKESKDKIKEKHKEKHKDGKEKASQHSKDKSSKVSEHSKDKLKIVEHSKEKLNKTSEHPKEKSSTSEHGKVKPTSEHSKEKSDKASVHHKEKSGEKHKEKHTDKTKEKSEKPKEKEKAQKQAETSPPMKKIKIEIKEDILTPPKPKPPVVKVKSEIESEDEMPLAVRKPSKLSKSIKKEEESDDEPLSSRAEKVKKIKTEKPIKKRKQESDEDNDDYKKPVKKAKKPAPKAKKEEPVSGSPKKKAKKEDAEEVWKWWEEEKMEEGVKWRTLEHYGPVFAPPYERVPNNIKFYYNGKPMALSEVAEEVAGFYGKMLDHEYTTKDSFNTNFFKDWRKVMTKEEREIITDLKKCRFDDFNDYYKMKSEERKAMSKEQKAEIKKENETLTEKYGFCVIDGHRQKIGNFRIEPPGLFRGRGEHPKMGMLKRRVVAEDISINLSKGATVPEPPPGHKWKDVRHDNTVTWLASWAENILGSTKYIMLNPSSKLKGEKDWQKYETARKLKNHADRIRKTYTEDFKSKEMRVRQRAVALYFIDKLALRAGNEKDEDTADTVGCCSLRVEHITLDDEKDGQEYVVSFDFLGKDSIRYFNSVAVEKRAYKNLKLFMENKQPGDDLFDRLNTSILNKYLNELMEGLTAKVFRTYNASKTLQEQLDLLTKEDMSLPEKVLAYNRANRAVAILCNHQRAVPKGFDKSMENLKQKMDDKMNLIKEVKKEVKDLKQAAKHSAKGKMDFDKKKKRLQTLEEQYRKLEVQATDREENKQIALGTSKLNYLDPRISVAWCKKWDVSIDKIYNKTQRDKFRWAIEMAGPEYKF